MATSSSFPALWPPALVKDGLPLDPDAALPRPALAKSETVAPHSDLAVISVIVPVLNGMPWLAEQLRALVGQECSEPWEVVVADNGSTDETKSVVQEWAARIDKIRLVDASTVRGPGAARNAGARAARGELLAFCDADNVVQPGW
jgi:cellulose synthase/poly-beta-1,6-N-acetylglucosamine synthase-like glycosyltransferase